MDERDARLRSHEQNISHYQNMLKARLSEVELHFVEKRLSEERFKIAMLEFFRCKTAAASTTTAAATAVGEA
jgi:hypothetical protein